MTRAGLDAARLSVGDLDRIIPLVSDEQWEAPSACAGWRVIDVVAHLAALATEAADPPQPDPSWPKNRERYHDLRVNERRGWSHAEVVDEWHRSAPLQLKLLEAGQDEMVADDPVVVTGLGIYPRHLLANTMAFNVFCHLRNDMLAPDGPLPFTLPAPTSAEVGPAVEFMIAGIPQMQGPELTATVEEPLVLDLTGAGATTVTLVPGPADDSELIVQSGAHGRTRITSTALDFINWGTTRKPWRDYCAVTGDAEAAARFLDALNIM